MTNQDDTVKKQPDGKKKLSFAIDTNIFCYFNCGKRFNFGGCIFAFKNI